MRFRIVVIVLLLAVVQVLLTLGVWWVGRPPAPVAVAHVETPTPPTAAVQRLAELYASAAFRSVITFDYAALGELIARSAAWSEVLFVSVEDPNGKILAHSDGGKVGRSWDPAMANELKARYGGAYREVRAPMTDGRRSGTTSPSAGQVRLAYSVSATPPPVPVPAPPARRDRVPLWMLLGAAALLAVPLGLLVSWLREASYGRGVKSIRHAKLVIAELTQEAERHRAASADHTARLAQLGDEVAERTTRLRDAENEIRLLRETAARREDASRRVHAELESRAAELEEARATVRVATEITANLEAKLERMHLLEAELVDLHGEVAQARAARSEPAAVSRESVDDEVRQRQTRAVGYIAQAIRSSLTNVLGFSKLLLRGAEGPLTDLQRVDVLNIQTAGTELLAVINDLVDLTQLDNGLLELGQELVDVRDVLADTAATAIRLGRSADDVLVESPSALPLVKTDRSRLAQILGTLVEQAPDAGPLVLRARSAADHVEIGVGGPPTAAAKTLDDLCEPFPPTEALSPLQDGGRRLRLALARRLALASGGTLTLQQDAAATTFTLTLPAPVDALTFA